MCSVKTLISMSSLYNYITHAKAGEAISDILVLKTYAYRSHAQLSNEARGQNFWTPPSETTLLFVCKQ